MNKLFFCCLILGTVLLVSADIEIIPETNDHPGPYKGYSEELKNINPELFFDLDSAAFARMTLEDPLLKYAYRDIFSQSLGGLDNSKSVQALALADMRSRGEAVTPMLLKLANENQETNYEFCLLLYVDQVGSIRLLPYLEYARNLLRQRTQTMNAGLAFTASELLAKHGSKEDAELLAWVIQERPYVAREVSEYLKVLKVRLEIPNQSSRPILRDRPFSSGAMNDGITKNPPIPSAENKSGNAVTTSRLVWVAIVIVILAMLWLLYGKTSKRSR